MYQVPLPRHERRHSAVHERRRTAQANDSTTRREGSFVTRSRTVDKNVSCARNNRIWSMYETTIDVSYARSRYAVRVYVIARSRDAPTVTANVTQAGYCWHLS